MLLLTTGASGVGKSTVRALIAPQLAPAVEGVELSHLAPPPAAPTRVWRQQATEVAARLRHRGDDPALWPHHQAFAEWMLRHATDPLHMTHVLSDGGWGEMRWDRLEQLGAGWSVHTIDATHLSRPEAADATLEWCRAAIAGTIPLVRVGPDAIRRRASPA